MHPILVETNLPQDGNAADLKRVRSILINLAESPLGWLKARGLVSDRQYAAGELLRRDYEIANLGPHVTMQWDAGPISAAGRAAANPGASTITQISAKQRFLSAVDAAGPGLSEILWRVVCAGESMPIAEKGLGWPTRSGRLVLTLALDRVADFYCVR